MFDLTEGELSQCNLLLKQMREKVRDEDSTVRGFNMGVNAGAVAGQTVMHCLIHLIPRRAGDMHNPRVG